MDKILERYCDTKSYNIIVLQSVTTDRQNLLFLQQYPTGAPDVWCSHYRVKPPGNSTNRWLV
jgi:hypothetical protein